MRSGQLLPLVLLTIALPSLTPALAGERRAPRNYQAPPAQITSGDTTWERIPIRYVDVRVVAAALGAPVMPSEWEVWQMKMRGGQFGGGQFGGSQFGGGMYGSGGGLGNPSGGGPYAGGLMGGGLMGGGLTGDSGSNSLMAGPNGGFRAGRLFGDPSTNALYFQYGPAR